MKKLFLLFFIASPVMANTQHLDCTLSNVELENPDHYTKSSVETGLLGSQSKGVVSINYNGGVSYIKVGKFYITGDVLIQKSKVTLIEHIGQASFDRSNNNIEITHINTSMPRVITYHCRTQKKSFF